jgi:hypothetical protein
MLARRRHRGPVAPLAAALVLIAVTACASPTSTGAPSPSPSTASTAPGAVPSRANSEPPLSRPSATPPVPGLSWVKATDVQRPDEAFAEPSAAATGPSGPGTAGHPGHFPGQAIVDDVVQAAHGLVAVGYVGIDGVWTAIAWRSTDGEHWALEPIDATPGSFAVAITAGRGGLEHDAYAAGRSGREPVVWADAGDGHWTPTHLPALGGGAVPERVVAITATDGGLLAGGSAGPELGDRRARFWRSRDGAQWEALPDDDAFAGAEVVAIEPLDGGGYVAAGRLGTGQRGTGSVALVSDDGVTWRRIDDPSLATGLVNGFATAADGSIVAVGSDLDEREALVWRSTDGGATWEAAPREASRLYEPYKIRMTDVVATPGGLVAVGNYVGLQYGTATSWVATDWTHWTRAPNYPALGQGEMLAVTRGGPGLVATGSFGAPDNYIPTIWLGEAPGG